MDKKVVLTVCNGNIHRSVIAEICLTRELKKHGLENVVCISRGLESRPAGKCNMMHFPDEWALTEPILKELDIIVSPDRRAVQINWETAEEASVILAMDRRVLRILWDRFPLSAFKMRLFSELVGKCEDIVDCKGITDDPETHRKANVCINEIATNGISFLRELLDWHNREKKNPGEVVKLNMDSYITYKAHSQYWVQYPDPTPNPQPLLSRENSAWEAVITRTLIYQSFKKRPVIQEIDWQVTLEKGTIGYVLRRELSIAVDQLRLVPCLEFVPTEYNGNKINQEEKVFFLPASFLRLISEDILCFCGGHMGERIFTRWSWDEL